MSDVKWTPAQQDAIDARAGNVLVSAAAGSGKTAVLVERIIQAVLDRDNPVSIDRMLIVTFTRAATYEMRVRIENAIDNLLRDDPYNKYLISQKQLLYSAKILTIDGFCSEFIRNYFYRLDIQRDFRVPDEGESTVLQNKALDSVLEYFYSQGDKAFTDLVSAICSLKNDKALRDNVLEVYKFLCSVPFPDLWLDEKLAYYGDTEFSETPYFRCIMKYAQECLLYCLELNTLCFKYLEQDDILPEDKLDKIRDMLKLDFALLNSINADIMNGDWDAVYNSVSEIKFGNFPSIRGANDDRYKELIKSVRGRYKDEVTALKKVFIADTAAINSDTVRLYPLVGAFFDCVRRFLHEYMALKNSLNLLDFSDVEHLAVSLLCEHNGGEIRFTDISEEISSEFDLIMVDEFQDINETQDLLFKAISRDKNNLFVVGDVKQSIYGFRQAKPEIFINYKDNYKLFDRSNPEYPAKIILDKNFRSRRGITEACNFIFSSLMSREIGGLEYNDEERLVCGASYDGKSSVNTELMLIDSGNINSEEDETKTLFEAHRVAQKIIELVYEEKLQIKDGDSMRTVRFGDIAILLRSAKGAERRAAVFANVLGEYGVSVISELKSSFFEQNEIKIMLNMLRVIDNPVQDIPLLSVMMSPMFGFTADDMAVIRAAHRNMPIYNAVKAHSAIDGKCARFIAFVDWMRTLAATSEVDKLIDTVIVATGFKSVVSALGRKASKNLYLLLDYARKFSANGYRTLSSFVNYIDLLIERGADLNAGGDSGDEALNAVRVMSIHSSKGLEFPVCFLSTASTRFNLTDTNAAMTVESEGGIGFKYREKLVRYDTIQRKAISMMIRDARLSEEMRILYVALTRAKERLIITSVVKEPRKYLESLEGKITAYPLSPYLIKNSRSFSDWLFTCALINPSCGNIRTNIKPDYTNWSESDVPWRIQIVSDIPSKDEDGGEYSGYTDDREENPEFMRLFLSRANYVYKDKPMQTLPQKVSASTLAHKDDRVFSKLLRKPDFSAAKKNGAEAGSAFHAFMEKCDFNFAVKNADAEARRLVESGFLSEREYSMLDFKKLGEFLGGPLIKRVLASERYYREYTFTVKINASDYNPDIDEEFSDKRIIMQGAVDLAFVEDGGVVIVDYKTDRVKDTAKLAERYRRQLELYKEALTQTLDLPVKEVIIHSVYLNESIALPKNF